MGGGAAQFWSLQKKVCSEVCQIVKGVKSSSGFVWPENHSTQRSQRVTAQHLEAGSHARPPQVPHVSLMLPLVYRNAEWPHPWGTRKAERQVLAQVKARVPSLPHLCVWAELLLCWKGGCPAPHLPAAQWEDFFCAFGSFDMWWRFSVFPRGIEGKLPQNYFYVILTLYCVPVGFQPVVSQSVW